MAENTEIAWTHHTNNLWHGCVEVCDMCDECYARILSARWGHDVWGAKKPRRMIKAFWKDLARFQKLASAAGEYHRVFIGSMMDIFEKPMPLIDSKGEPIAYHTTGDLRMRLFKEISAGMYPNLIMLFLTKRPGNIPKYVPAEWLRNPPANVMYGCSPSTIKDVETLLKVPGNVFLSMEPLIKPPFPELEVLLQHVSWLICGGESGPKARPAHSDWYRQLKDWCAESGTAYFFKQFGHYLPESQVYYTSMSLDEIRKKSGYTIWPDGKYHEMKANDPGVHFDIGERVRAVGKGAAGHMLDGKEYYEFPAYHSWPNLTSPPLTEKERTELIMGDWKCES